MSSLDFNKTVHIIVHGQNDLVKPVRQKLMALGFPETNIRQASLDAAGNQGDYVAMVWPPMAAKHIILNEIIGAREDSNAGPGMGAWAKVEQKELSRITL
jgi:hypothetical protein